MDGLPVGEKKLDSFVKSSSCCSNKADTVTQ